MALCALKSFTDFFKQSNKCLSQSFFTYLYFLDVEWCSVCVFFMLCIIELMFFNNLIYICLIEHWVKFILKTIACEILGQSFYVSKIYQFYWENIFKNIILYYSFNYKYARIMKYTQARDWTCVLDKTIRALNHRSTLDWRWK